MRSQALTAEDQTGGAVCPFHGRNPGSGGFGAVAGTLDIIPMIFQRLPMRSCLSAFFIYFFAAVIVFYSDLPYLPWWADGMAVTLMLMIPVLFTFSGRERKAIPVVLFNALLFGFLISAAEKYLA